MQEFIINGGRRLNGAAELKGAKNAVLPILAASLLSREESVLLKVPLPEDVFTMCELLRAYGAKLSFEGSTLYIDPHDIQPAQPDEEAFKSMRASALLMAPLLRRLSFFGIPLPGGCAIGSRPLDYHLKALTALGAEILDTGDRLLLRGGPLIGTEICLDFPSVGATENIMLAACTACGRTLIRNAACEPEIADLAAFLNAMGARVYGAGSSVIEIEGVLTLHGAQHEIMPDRIELGTLMTAAAICGGDCVLRGGAVGAAAAVIAKLRENGVSVREYPDGVRVTAKARPRAANIITMPYPGFPTDMQPQYMALMCVAEGCSVITESLFENRFRHVAGMRRMGADIRVLGGSAVVFGREGLHGAVTEATDLRAGAALVLLALAAEGESRVRNARYIDRGYQCLEKTLSELGAEIKRGSDTENL